MRALPALLLAGLALGCSPTPDGGPDGGGRTPSTAAMAARLDSVASVAESRGFEYMNRARVRQLAARSVPGDLRSQVVHRFELAGELLRAGASAEARDTLEAVRTLVADRSEVPAEFVHAVEELLGLSNLRIAEQENCVLDPGSGMCLLPISLEAVHRKQEGSRAAMEWYARVLERAPDDLASRWLLNVAAMTVGEHPAGVPERWRIPAEVFAGEAFPAFPEVAKQVGLATMALAGGAVVDDFDGDGDFDVFATSWGLRDPVRLFENRGDGRFEERSSAAGLDGIVGGLNAMQTDVDGDGLLDLFVLRGAWLPEGQPNSLLRNRGDGTFTDVTEAAGLLDHRSSQTAAWADFDNDGDLDVYVGNEASFGRAHPAQLFLNRGDGTFVDRAGPAGAAVPGFIKGVAAGDVDNDGWIDLYVSRLGQGNVLLRNRGTDETGLPRFDDVTERAGVAEPRESFPTWFFDVDDDGFEDLFVSGYNGNAGDVAAEYLGLPHDGVTPRLYRNRGDGTFEDVTVAAGLDGPFLTMGSNFGDLDNDGRLDLYLGTGDPDFRSIVPNRMFRNVDGRRFADVTSAGGFGHIQKGHGIAFADLDGDGDQDVFAVMGGAFEGDTFHDALFANPGFGRRWLGLRLEGVRANRPAIGARVRVTVRTGDGGVRTLHRTVRSGSSFGASPLQLHFGLADATAVLSVEVDWPGSTVRDRHTEGVDLDRVYRLREGDPRPEPLEVSRFDLLRAADGSAPDSPGDPHGG